MNANGDTAQLSNTEPPPSYSSAVAESSSSSKTPHKLFFPDSKTPWVILTLFSCALDSSPLPSYMKNGVIEGDIRLNLKKPMFIRWIDLNLKGTVTNSSGYETIFWSRQKTLYLYDQCDPSLPTSNSKLSQTHTFPFKILLPRLVSFKYNERYVNIELPPTHKGHSTVTYHLEVEIERGIFRSTVRLGTEWNYSPHSRAPWSSTACLILSQLQFPYSTPVDELDSEVWKTLPQVNIQGIFREKRVAIGYRLSIARPLKFARGSVIPFHLSVSSEDAKVLALFTSPSSLLVGLVQIESWSASLNKTYKPFRNVEGIASASRWTNISAIKNPINMCESVKAVSLEGEIRLPHLLTPTFDIAGSGVTYAVYLFPSRVSEFVPRAMFKGPLTSHFVKVVTDAPRGLSCHYSFLPPTYGSEDSSERKDLDDMKTHLESWKMVSLVEVYSGDWML